MTRPQIVTIDLGGVQGKEELHECLAQSLECTDWYGRNWDAFWDAITAVWICRRCWVCTDGLSFPCPCQKSQAS
ncbi:barstar family protein [Pseudomonas sp. Pseusp97]|uniref:barstar family protein n=1 Tax=Pseudomonas sp. Pseusp97 TaxID=3243065 RepID=UPI0039A6378D